MVCTGLRSLGQAYVDEKQAEVEKSRFLQKSVVKCANFVSLLGFRALRFRVDVVEPINGAAQSPQSKDDLELSVVGPQAS